jgi:hypothetical protein
MWWRGLSAAYETNLLWCWHSLPDWQQAEIIAVHEIKQDLLAARNKD